MARLQDYILRDTRTNQPDASVVAAGTLYCVSDEGNIVERSNGTDWESYSPTVGGGGGGGGGDGWTHIPLLENSLRVSTVTKSLDSVLQFEMEANELYAVRGALRLGLGAGGFRYTLVGPTSPLYITGITRHIHSAALTTQVAALQQAFAFTDITMIGGVAFVTLDFIIANGVNNGSFGISWAQNTSSAENSLIRLGSYLEFKRVA